MVVADFIEPLNSLPKLAWSEFGGLLNSECSSAASISSADQRRWPSETSLEQLLGHDQPRTNQCCCWPLVKRLLLVIRSQGGHDEQRIH